MSSGAVTWGVGAVEITRVEDPGFDLTLSQDEETRKALAAAEWLSPWSVTEDLSLRIGSSATIVRTPSAVVLVDPFLAFDDVARLGPRLSALRSEEHTSELQSLMRISYAVFCLKKKKKHHKKYQHKTNTKTK